jgi:hypothetical protein
MPFDSQMTGGYPTISEIEDALAERGIELPTPHNPNWYSELQKMVWGLINALDWATVLGVFCPSPATFNVRGGKYLYKDMAKTYTPGDSVDPTDNDTTYIWMASDNTIDYDVDEIGWPATEHIKLAEIDVDEAGIITAIRDLRGQSFMQLIGNLTGNHVAVIGANGGVPFLFTATLTAGSTVVIHNANAPFKYRIVKAWSVAMSSDGGTWQVKNGANAVTEAVTVTGTDKTVNNAGTIDDTYHEVVAGGSLSVAGDGANADVIVYIECIRIV